MVIRDFLKWTEKKYGKGFNASIILREGTLGYTGPALHKKQIMFLGDEIYHIKEPHSRYFKNNAGDFGVGDSVRDNELSTATELLSEMRYRAFRIPYAYYDVFRGDSGEFKLISKDIVTPDIEMRTLADLFSYEDEFLNKYARKFSMQTLEEIITHPAVALKIMTQKCYDQFVMYMLASIFDLADDEHFNDVIFVRNQNSGLFESMFLCDKESNLFNPLIAREFSMDEVITMSKEYSNYVGFHVSDRNENFDQRVAVLLKMIRKGTMPKKFINFLNTIANFDFEKAAKEIKNKYDVKLDERQLDIHKRFAEIAGELSQRG